MVVKICVGSSCCLKGSNILIGKFQKAIAESGKANEITLAGSFCMGKCSTVGVTVQVDNEIYTGVTPEGFDEFWQNAVIAKL